jgi:tetratricopeptide (TPR) repeat protein
MLGDLDHAIECYRRGIKIDPKDKQGHRFLGDVLERKYGHTKQRKLLEEAIRCYETALRIDPPYGYAKESLTAAKARLKKDPSRELCLGTQSVAGLLAWHR